MRLKSFALAVCVLATAVIPTNSVGLLAEGQTVEIPNGFDVVVETGVPTIIYGQFNQGCHQVEAPSLEWVIRKKVTQMPVNGALSDGGIGKRFRDLCRREVFVRAIEYTSKPGFIGIDGVVFSDMDAVVITILPPENR